MCFGLGRVMIKYDHCDKGDTINIVLLYSSPYMPTSEATTHCTNMAAPVKAPALKATCNREAGFCFATSHFSIASLHTPAAGCTGCASLAKSFPYTIPGHCGGLICLPTSLERHFPWPQKLLQQNISCVQMEAIGHTHTMQHFKSYHA